MVAIIQNCGCFTVAAIVYARGVNETANEGRDIPVPQIAPEETVDKRLPA